MGTESMGTEADRQEDGCQDRAGSRDDGGHLVREGGGGPRCCGRLSGRSAVHLCEPARDPETQPPEENPP
ncbi:hypothetical protein Cma02nite_28520 [Cellulomonas marina]|nr:hypothetical protein Cma02nite_28520 [Cellulomonas marina]